MDTRVKWIVVDANAFIHCSQLKQVALSAKLCTTSSVLNELKDQKTKDLINSLPFEIKIEIASEKSLKIVKEFARKTGDIVSLSETDLEIIALGYDCCEKLGLLEKLNKEPKPFQEMNQAEAQGEEQEPEGENQEEEDEVGQEEEQQDQENGPGEDDGWITVQGKKPKHKEVDEDDDDGWITPENYHQKKQATAIDRVEEQPQKDELPVSIMTSDFAMQNVILQMGIHLISIEGIEVKSVRRFIVECYLCHKRYPEITTDKIQTCSKCGYNSLSKIAYSLDNRGNMILHRKRNWKPNKKVQEWKQRKLEEQERNKRNRKKAKSKESFYFRGFDFQLICIHSNLISMHKTQLKTRSRNSLSKSCWHYLIMKSIIFCPSSTRISVSSSS